MGAWREMAERDRRAVLAGAAVLALGLGVRGIALPYLDRVRDARERVEREEAMLERERTLLREARGYRTAFDSLGGRLVSTVPRLMRGGALSGTQATLARRLDDAARAAPALLSRVEALAPRPAGAGLLAIPLRVEGESDYEGFLGLLADLEAGPTLFHLSDLEVRARDGGAPPDPAAPPRPVVVSFRFTVTGFVLEQGGAANDTAAAREGSAAPDSAAAQGDTAAPTPAAPGRASADARKEGR